MSSERSDDARLDGTSIVIQGLLELSGSCGGGGDAATPAAATSSAPAADPDRPAGGGKVDAAACETANTDDESTVSIGEIGVDEYFDHVPRDSVDFDAAAASEGVGVGGSGGGGTDSGGPSNGSRGVLKRAAVLLSQSHTRIMKSRKTDAVIAATHVYSTPKPRAAAVRATEAISKCCHKRKRRQTARKEQQQTANESNVVRQIENSALEDFGVLVPSLLYRNFFLDRRIMRQSQNCLITRLPAKPTIYDFLTDFARKNDAHPGVLGFIMETFNKFLLGWCLDFIERLQYKQMIERYPNRPVYKIYGIIHFTRFLVYLPSMLKLTTENAPLFTEAITPFLNGFLDYMDDEQLGINFDIHYEHVMPEYYRMTFCPLRNYTKPNRT